MRGKFLMKPQDCIETPLTAAFRAACAGPLERSREPLNPARSNSTIGESATGVRPADGQLSTLRKEGR
jgi:hypothetical protein